MRIEVVIVCIIPPIIITRLNTYEDENLFCRRSGDDDAGCMQQGRRNGGAAPCREDVYKRQIQKSPSCHKILFHFIKKEFLLKTY